MNRGETGGQQKGISKLVAELSHMEGVNEAVVVRQNGDILYYKSNRPLLKNSVPFLVNKAKKAGEIFGFSGFSHAAMQRGKGRKMVVMTGGDLMVGLEADARCLQAVLLEKVYPLLLSARGGGM